MLLLLLKLVLALVGVLGVVAVVAMLQMVAVGVAVVATVVRWTHRSGAVVAIVAVVVEGEGRARWRSQSGSSSSGGGGGRLAVAVAGKSSISSWRYGRCHRSVVLARSCEIIHRERGREGLELRLRGSEGMSNRCDSLPVCSYMGSSPNQGF